MASSKHDRAVGELANAAVCKTATVGAIPTRPSNARVVQRQNGSPVKSRRRLDTDRGLHFRGHSTAGCRTVNAVMLVRVRPPELRVSRPTRS